MKRVVVTGAGGFIGNRLVQYLKSQGSWVRGVDVQLPGYGDTDADQFEVLDLSELESCRRATAGVDEVYALAADMGGMGYISQNHARILRQNALINMHTIEAARENGVRRYLFASSACIYPEYLQDSTDVRPLREEDAYPAQPQDAYGWEKLVTERLCMHYRAECDLETRIVRFHNIFGPYGTWRGGREKAPAALSRKIAIAKLTRNPEVQIWGDGEQTRSFCYVDDCVVGLTKVMESDYAEPLNLGQDRLVTINELVDMIAEIAGIDVEKRYVPGPQGVRGRNSDNSRLREVVGWEPEISLEDGLARTYSWIEDQVWAELEAGLDPETGEPQRHAESVRAEAPAPAVSAPAR